MVYKLALLFLSGDNIAPELGNALMLKYMPLGTMIHNVEMQPGQGGKLVRSAGNTAQLANKEEKYGILKMPSGELRKVLINCYATVGVVSNSDHNLESAGKAGRNRWKGVRPRTRAVAMATRGPSIATYASLDLRTATLPHELGKENS